MSKYRLQLNSESAQWLQSMHTVLKELTNWEVAINQLTFDTVARLESAQPDILVWKIENDLACLDLEELKERCPMVIPVIIINDPNQLDMQQFMQYGICGCLPSRLRPRQIVDAISLIAAGGITCFPRFASKQTPGQHLEQLPVSSKLTCREREILSLLCQNSSNQEMAHALSVSESTVKTHLHNIYRKMGKRKRGEVLAAVYNLEEARRGTECSH